MSALAPAAAHYTAADFSEETWWLSLIKAVFIIVFLILNVLLALWVERRGLGRMQTRPGPNVAGPLGLFQAFADAVKLLFKEDMWTRRAERFLYFLAPAIAAFAAFSVFAVIPMGPNVSLFGHSSPLQLADMPVATLYILAIASLGLYGIVLGGWSTRSTLPLYGAVRSSAQVISYELAMGLSLVSVFLMSGTMSTSQIVAAQGQYWWVFTLFPAFVIYCVSATGEVNRLPFDLPEAEGELVAGHMTEYSSMKFGWYYLSEYVNMLNVSAVATTMFLGGWHAPWPLSQVEFLASGWMGMVWFFLKMWFFMFLLIWTRATLLRFRYDQFMALGWKWLMPIALAWLVMVALVRGLTQFVTVSAPVLYGSVAVVFLIALVVIWVTDPGEEPAHDPAEGLGTIGHVEKRALGVRQRGQQPQVLLELEDEQVGVLLDLADDRQDLGHGTGHGRRGRHAHARGDQVGDLAGQLRQRHRVQRLDADGSQLAGQLVGTVLSDLAPRGSARGDLALAGAHGAVDLFRRLLRDGVERLGAYREVPAIDRHDGGEDAVVQAVRRAVDHVGAHRYVGLEVVPHEPEDAGRHVQVPDDVVGRPDQPLARVARQAVEGAVGPQDDALGISCGKKDVVRFEEPLVSDLRLHVCSLLNARGASAHASGDRGGFSCELGDRARY